MSLDWFKARGYAHFDAAVGAHYAQSVGKSLVERHSWSPLISYTKRIKRYKPSLGKTQYKEREIMYASHRDSCILSKYSHELTGLLNKYYEEEKLENSVIAYRALGKANYDFSADAYRFATAHAPCLMLCFDVTGFFDNLDHKLLKERLKRILNVKELPKDWYSVFRHVTRYHHVRKDALAQHPKFGPKLAKRSRQPLATIAEVILAGIPIIPNKSGSFGIPQGTPISSALSNLYLVDLDKEMWALCNGVGALYQRYSDDILIICPLSQEAFLTKALTDQISLHKLEVNPSKIDRMVFDASKPEAVQYLGFNLSPSGAVIRQSSLSRQWRKLKRSIARATRAGTKAISEGKAKKIYTKKLRRRFDAVGARNFSSYSRRAAKSFGSKKIVRQVRRLERAADAAIRDLNT
jgi:RNA-directed DNA polymerase